MKTKIIVASLLLGSVFNSSPVVHAATQAKQAAHQAPKVNGTAGVYFRTIKVDGLDIFYREAGDKSKPTILLLHGFPSSSHMFRDLIRDLAPNYHLIAPDYPGFGQSSAPEPTAYNYTFDNLAATMNHFIDALGLKQFSLYVQDYGGPVGFRIASARPGLIQSIIVQNANAYTEGLGDALKPLVAYIQNPGESTSGPVKGFLSIEGTKWQYTDGAEDVSEIDPDSYITDQYYLNRPGNQNIQLALFRNYGTNLLLYATWQAYFKKYQPLTLVISGKNDKLFVAAGAMAYKKDLPKAEIHLLNGGHFVLEEKHEEAAGLIRSFLLKNNIK
ncbi:alpha/beta hydrolase [Mucilaginibacter rubeus]|uniref:Alpha/beta hydrolase n=1 Tax=Mucilaginibacter rubeus TaxID=2027860 RepID=A0AAE6MGI3_9SPHI|nr:MULTISPECIES: alpha/beta hydrolase [Mucilaginibacter]QEM02541.1 alpha/beta hydrolase [Mucilaginibacter rubeus]QEM15161.1 alpha/beta hydrolase [Mucilaginibacter gossypii]QTE42116.1 alpha/beta hydrolase [Mucilaginibacter rubeus]QTE48717.1 alpha/beta hydrolase [Mucilaginibacter rubeus]QTE53815.1 alpha/beta hydrolase [Mucilaginibacter rubeus]